MKKNHLLGIFALILISFAIFSSRIIFHDVPEYVTATKYFAGIENLNIFVGHSMLYPMVLSLFLKIWPSLMMIKLINVFLIFVIGATMLIWLKNKKAFLIFAFSPLTWFMSIQITPVLVSGLLLMLAYIFLKKESIKFHKYFSGFFLGLSAAFYTPMLLIGGIFVLVYFWGKNLSEVVKYLVVFSIGVLPRMILDFYFFGNVFYSIIKYAGANFVVSAGLNPNISNFAILNSFGFLLIIIVISPLLYKLYRLNFKENKNEILFLILAGAMLLIRTGGMKYFMILSPIIVLVLSKVLTKKEFMIHCIVSVILVVILTFGFFGAGEDVLIKKDMERIISEFEVDYIIAGPYEANSLAMFLWDNFPKVVWFMDYEASLNNETSFKEYSFLINRKGNARENLVISADFQRPEEIDYGNYIFASKDKEFMSERFEEIKCYEVLCVYED